MDDDYIMDMEMDMDVPLPEELELLESTYRIYEQQQDQEDHYFYQPPEDETEFEQQPPQDLVSPSEPQSNSHKRSRSKSNSDCDLEDLDSSGVEKREKVRVRVEDPPVEEDWLRYSPPPTTTTTTTTTSVEEVKLSEEKTLSRFASEIDGEVMPITAPNGDRVYTKFDRFYGDEQVTKLNCRGYSSGSYSFLELSSFVQFLHKFTITYFNLQFFFGLVA
jgi:chromosome transmission fidelity protein 18